MALLKDNLRPEFDVEVAGDLMSALHTEIMEDLAVSLGSWDFERDSVAGDGNC